MKFSNELSDAQVGRQVLHQLTVHETWAQKQARERLVAESLRKASKPRSFTSLSSPLNTLNLPGVKIHPTYDRVLVEFEDVTDKTKGGIWLPQNRVIRKAGEGYPARVLAVGPGRFLRKNKTMFQRVPCSVKAGDRVMVPCLNFPLFMDGCEVYLCNEDALFGILEEV